MLQASPPGPKLPHCLSARHDAVFQNRCSDTFARNILSARRAFIAYQEKSLLVAVFQLGAKFGRLLHYRPPPIFRSFQVQQSRLPLALTYCKPQGYENRDCTDTYGNNFGGQANTLTSTCGVSLVSGPRTRVRVMGHQLAVRISRVALESRARNWRRRL